MIAAEKPPLEAVHLAHFGVKGMKWGSRKSRSANASKQKMSTGKKVAIGLGVAAVGAAAVTLALTRTGNTRLGALRSQSARNLPPRQGFRRNFDPRKAWQANEQLGVPRVVRTKSGAIPMPGRQTPAASVANGRQAAARIADQAKWKKSVNAVLADIKEANAEQDSWMRKMGLGAALNRPI